MRTIMERMESPALEKSRSSTRIPIRPLGGPYKSMVTTLRSPGALCRNTREEVGSDRTEVGGRPRTSEGIVAMLQNSMVQIPKDHVLTTPLTR